MRVLAITWLVVYGHWMIAKMAEPKVMETRANVERFIVGR